MKTVNLRPISLIDIAALVVERRVAIDHYSEDEVNAFDKQNTLNDWAMYICKYATQAASLENIESPEEAYGCLIKAANLALLAARRVREGTLAPRHYDEQPLKPFYYEDWVAKYGPYDNWFEETIELSGEPAKCGDTVPERIIEPGKDFLPFEGLDGIHRPGGDGIVP